MKICSDPFFLGHGPSALSWSNMLALPRRVAIAGILHESNTFSAVKTTLGDFERTALRRGSAILDEWAESQHEIGGFIAGATAPPGKRMGHAGALISGADDTAPAKMEAMRSAGFVVSDSPAGLGDAVVEAIKKAA